MAIQHRSPRYNESSSMVETFSWEDYQSGTMGGFMKALAKAFDEADMQNLAKLAKAFPEVYTVYASYHGDILNK